ncbi:MAG: sigma-70 family RNA polymerase sigma factor [Kiritimatiellae bacterium]|nr:sigma-70 family RNA polymerase sigma factor [Kiritimatiellia bacterium]
MPDTSTGLLRDLGRGPDATRWPDFARRYDPVVRRFVAVVARTHPLVRPDDCDDIVQETMIALWRLFPRRGYDRSRGRFRDFLFGVVRKVATKASSRERVRLEREAEALRGAAEDQASAAGDAALRAEAEALWLEAVDAVFASGRWSDKAKAVYVRTERGEDIAAVAAAYGMDPNSVHQLRYRASRRLETELRRLSAPGGDFAAAIRASHP